jgi:mono/diheme cytochrome c family protein
MRRGSFAPALALLLSVAPAVAGEPTPAERGRQALLERCFNPAVWPASAYTDAWKHWGAARPPAGYDRAFREYYGLHEAPYPNNGLPMGLRESPYLLSKGLSVDCLVCHGGSVAGKSYVGLGNASLDVEALFQDMSSRPGGKTVHTPFRFTNVRGTSEAGGMAVYLLGFRNPDLTLRGKRLDLGLHEDMCEDPPAWWLLKKKKSMYHTGGTDARSVRSIMQFMMSPLNSPETFAREEATFRDIRAYMLTLTPPKYPFPIDAALAAKGESVFRRDCSRCHGTYGESWTYPNKVIPLDEIGTDRKRYDGIEEAFGRYYNQSWFAKEKPGWLADEMVELPSAGYQAPPLDGIWATAPYLHNGSVPTVYDLLKSGDRPARFTRSYRTDAGEYDAKKLGWKVTPAAAPDPRLPVVERRKVYDTSQPGRGNRGHTFGDDLTDAERWAVIEYLKTL